jgi:hypothetical protein
MEAGVTARKWLMNGLVAATVAVCLTILGCSGKKGHCSTCQNNNDCSSGECATFVTDSGNRSLLCGDNSINDTCSVAR